MLHFKQNYMVLNRLVDLEKHQIWEWRFNPSIFPPTCIFLLFQERNLFE